MAQRTGLSWEGLSEPARQIVRWASAAERGREVGSRGLLLGLLRATPDSPTRMTLQHFDVSDEELFDMLQRQVSVALEPSAERAAELRELPALTTNAERILTRAVELADEVHTDDVAVCIFGALLDTPASTAAVALSNTLKRASLPELRQSYFDWLHANDLSWAQTLERDFPRMHDAAAKGALRLAEPWPFLVLLSDPRSNPSGGPVVRGQACFVRPWLVVTPATLVEQSGQTAFRGSEVIGLTPDARDEQLALLRVVSPFELDDESLPPLGELPSGDAACQIAVVDGNDRSWRLVDGRIASSGADFTVELAAPISARHHPLGSPVMAGGQLVGIVVALAGANIVRALDVSHLRRLLEASSAPRAPVSGTLAGAGNDAVGDVDQLGFKPYVTAFADLITSPHTKPPLTIGIFGSWGSGKSFLLEHIEREIDARHDKQPETIPRVHVVRFNAWEYSATEVVWPGLVRKIVTRLDKLTTWPKRKRVWTRLRWNLSRQWSALRVQLITVLLVVGAAIAAALAQDEQGLAAAIFGVAATLGVGGVLKAAKDPVAQWVTALFAGSDYGRQLGVMEDIKHDLETLEARLHRIDADGHDVVTGRILVLIDDLDRCEPAKAVEVLQAVNLLLNFSSFIVVLGIDARIVTGAIEKHYEGLLGKAGASGYEYLDKIVQIPFRIPEPGRDEIMAFVAGQLGNPKRPQEDGTQDAATPSGAEGENAEDQAPRDNAGPPPGDADGAAPALQQQEAPPGDGPVVPEVVPAPEAGVPFTGSELVAFEHFADHLRPNPRHLKRLVNVYRLVRALAHAQHETLIIERPAATIRWLVMWSQWPYASLAMIERFDAQLDEWKGTIPDDQREVDALPLLLAQVAPTLDEEIRDRLDDDARELHELLAVEGCGLTWDEIRRIRRYTVNFNPAVEEQLRAPGRNDSKS